MVRLAVETGCLSSSNTDPPKEDTALPVVQAEADATRAKTVVNKSRNIIYAIVRQIEVKPVVITGTEGQF